MALPTLRIGKYEIQYPIIQGGMGVGISWENLAGNVSKNGCLGVVSSVGTGYRYPNYVKLKDGRPVGSKYIHNKEALTRIIKDAKEIAGGEKAVIGVNILCAITDYDRVVRDSIEAGANIIISGAGLPLRLPEYAEGSDVALVPIVSSARALRVICKHWKKKYNRLPDAVVLEGPLSGGHQGIPYEDCFKPEYQLENLLPEVLKERDMWGDFPVIVAGGIWSKEDIEWYISQGAAGVQMGTRFVGTYECDASMEFKKVIINAKKEDIVLLKSPVGYPARGIVTKLIKDIENGTAPEVKCISNCVVPCNHGEEAKKVGYCIADRLGDAYLGKVETGLFFSGSNGYRIKRLVHVKDLIRELVEGIPSGQEIPQEVDLVKT
ncbi:2-nitropropane dioxygenase [Sulfurihydrogenibium azorense Az-Fu1]|jgi:nitronate monooxygenase|uniref:2-nitropropane dioxygenase n=1 Tax=Sulfurihydrogenibium azorense (strain DSM 15241 / OCM 825 / Az-Fu1) TaxID=204536 RepID=C1DWQ0_SULAA|nr:nitronate monooxygenase family protein [Sulfurihydrogenibium azorense]ACN98641.1 2-nitropropane dioxygenase [Sulfurihydrogenibium azorense Az-Fu1]